MNKVIIKTRSKQLAGKLQGLASKLKRTITLIIITTLPLLVSGCATYKSSFNCGDAKGAYCASMDHVDGMIDSGEIEQFNERRLKQKHKTTSDNALSLPLKTELPAGAATAPTITNFEAEDAGD